MRVESWEGGFLRSSLSSEPQVYVPEMGFTIIIIITIIGPGGQLCPWRIMVQRFSRDSIT